jgi:hypothetical protein
LRSGKGLRRSAVFLFLGLLAVTGTAHADGILPEATAAGPNAIDLEAAVAATPFGSTRWSRLTIDGGRRVMWIVPVRPGAAVDWAPDAWLSGLDEATVVRVVPPTSAPPCTSPFPTASERAPAWTRTGSKRWPSGLASYSTETALRDHATQRGFGIRSELGGRIASLYARGWSMLALEVESNGAPRISTPTIRVTDDGPAELPFALVSAGPRATYMTVFAITSGPVTSRAAEVSADSIVWGPSGSNYATRRQSTSFSGEWVREVSSHEVLFDGIPVPNEPRTAPLTSSYFGGAPSCESAARIAASRAGSLGRVCAPGAALRVPGGTICAPSSGTIDAQAFVCEGSGDDLALALSGNAPHSMFVTRFAGRLSEAALGADDALSPIAEPRSPIVTAGAHERCTTSSDEAPITPPPPRGGMPIPLNGPVERDSYVYSGEGCSGSGGGDYYEEDTSEGCSTDSGGSDNGDYDDSSDDSDSDEDDSASDGSESDDSTSDDDSGEVEIEWGDDSDDSSDDSGDSSDDSEASQSSATSDGCSKGPAPTDTTSSALSTTRAGQGAKTTKRAHGEKPGLHGKHRHGSKHGAKQGTTTRRLKKREQSPVSRMALFLGALVLPFRRRTRVSSLPDVDLTRPSLRG